MSMLVHLHSPMQLASPRGTGGQVPCAPRVRWRKRTLVISSGMWQTSQVSGIPDMSRVRMAQAWEHCSCGDTEACLPRALCSPGWKQLISNCLHSNYLIVQKHCLVFQFSLSHCLPEGLFTALSLIWVGGVPVGEVNCQDRKNTMVARSWEPSP